ncbi:MAG: sigma-70 family RNA polymerase sigma factor [Acidobacteriota bacterium]|nr:sigma-70 family RNA polymerase sigma factor [Acidobacteriota bacterium]
MDREKGKSQNFNDIIKRFSRFIKANIQRFNLPKRGIDPDDIFQEVKIKIWKILNSEKEIKNYSSYIRKIVESSTIDHLRRLRKEEEVIFQEKQKQISERKTLYARNPLSDAKMEETIGHTVESLLESRKKVVKLFLLDMSIEEIAISFGWSNDKTRNLLYRGLNDLKKKLKERGIEYEN